MQMTVLPRKRRIVIVDDHTLIIGTIGPENPCVGTYRYDVGGDMQGQLEVEVRRSFPESDVESHRERQVDDEGGGGEEDAPAAPRPPRGGHQEPVRPVLDHVEDHTGETSRRRYGRSTCLFRVRLCARASARRVSRGSITSSTMARAAVR